MLEKSFTILTSSAAAAASADDYECRSFRSFISNELRNYLPGTRNKVLHEISYSLPISIILMFHISPRPVPPSQVSFPTTPSSIAGSEDVNLSAFKLCKLKCSFFTSTKKPHPTVNLMINKLSFPIKYLTLS